MRILIDTNVLLRFADRSQPEHHLVHASLTRLYEEGEILVTTFQNRAEFWNVATRPKKYNGFGIDHSEAKDMLRLIERMFPLFWHDADSYGYWRTIVNDYAVTGVQVHDARLVAIMLARNIERILTYNVQDFRRYEPAGIQAIHPATVLPSH